VKFRPLVLTAVTVFATLGAIIPSMAADAYPSKAIRIIVPHQSGSTTEIFGRMLSTEMSEILAQPIIIEPRAGAAGTIGAREVAQSKSDGYTTLMNASIQVMYPGMFKNFPLDPQKDFVAVGIFGFAPMVVVVKADSNIKTFKDMIEAARASPEKLSFASGGLGSMPHLVGELVNLRSNVKMTHVAYNGTSRATTDVAGGHVDVLYASVASVEQLIKGGSLRALAVTSATRVPMLPDVPTIAESGIPGFDVTSWYGLWAPKDTPSAVVATLNKAMRDASAMPAVQQRMQAQGIIPSKLSADEFARFSAEEGAKWLDVMKQANMQPN
jgi:tripartite-type tricarboxylate transporter receptor subunit TctC